MKTKDIVVLIVAIAIFAVAGYIAFTQLLPQGSTSSQNGVKVEVIGQIDPDFDATTLAKLADPTQVVDYNLPVDFSGLNNTAPFGR